MGTSIQDGGLNWVAGIDTSYLKKQIDEVNGLMSGLAKKAQEEQDQVAKLTRTAATGITAYLSFEATKRFIGQMVTIRGEFQQLEVAFTTMLGSKEKSDKLLKEVTEFAATTPFGLKEVAGAAKQLLAFGIDAEKVESTLRSLGDVAAGLGQPLGEIAYLYGTIKTAGVANSVDIKQFAQRGIPIYEELAKVLKVNVTAVNDLVSAGKVGFPQIEQVFQNLTAEGSKFGGLMEAQSKTLTGQISNLQDAVDQMFNDLGKDNEGLFSGAIESLTFLIEHFRDLLHILEVIAAAYGAYKAAVIATVVVERVQQEILLQKSLSFLRLNTLQALNAAITVNLNRVWKALNLTMKLNPIGLVIGAVTALVTAMIVFRDTTTAQERAQKTLNEANKEHAEQLDNIRDTTSKLVGVIKDETSTRFAQLEAFKQLQNLYPDMLKNMDLHAFKTLSADAAQKQFNEALDESKIKLQALDYAKAIAKVKEYESAVREAEKGHAQGNTIPLLQADLDQARATAEAFGAALDKTVETMKEANLTTEEQLANQNKAKQKLEEQREQIEKNIQGLDKMGVSALDFRRNLEEVNLKGLNKQLDDIIAKIASLTGQAASTKKDKAFFETQKKDAQAVIDALDVNDKSFNSTKATQTKIIREAEKELAKYDTTLKKNTTSTKEANKVETARNKLLEDRKRLILSIDELIKESALTGLTDEARALAEINEKYDKQLQSVRELNLEIEKFNKKNPKSPVALLGAAEVNRINAARANELANKKYKEDAELYIQSLQDKEAAFDAFQQAIVEGNFNVVDQVKGLYAQDLQGFSSYLEFLQSQLENLTATKLLRQAHGKSTTEQNVAIDAVTKMISDATKKADDSDKQRRAQVFKEALEAAKTFEQKKQEIIEKFAKEETEVRADAAGLTAEQQQKVVEALRKVRDQEIKDLENQAARETDIMKLATEDVFRFTRDELKKRSKLLKDALENDPSLTPAMKASVQSAVDMIDELLKKTDDFKERFAKALKYVGLAKELFSGIADAVRDTNKGLAETLDQMSSILATTESALTAVLQFESGDIAGGISSGISAITGIIKQFAAAKKSEEDAKKKILEFQQQIYDGEISYQELIRQRERDTIRLNKLTIQGIKDQNELLQKQKQITTDTYDEILKKLQNESFVSGQTTKKKHGSVFGGLAGYFFGGKTEIRDTLSSLAGKSFEELEKLFTSGQLTESAKKLFEQLQQIKQEGVDIDQLLEQNKKDAQQIFTGTTSESIADNIIEGFKAGKRSAGDFADSFQDMMQTALLNSLKFKYLEGPLQDFFASFADDAESGGAISADEIDRLRTMYNSILENANTQFEQLQQIAGINFNSTDASDNTLTGAIKGMTEQQAELLAGQFGGLRLTALDQLTIAKSGLLVLQNIEYNTNKIHDMYALWRRLEINGLKAL